METRIFLTGGTGFIGVNLLKEILAREPEAQITALVRAKSSEEARKRLLQILKKADQTSGWIGRSDRLVVVHGDICQPNLGLNPLCYEHITRTMTHLIHSAANVALDVPLNEARRVNVEGTRRVLDLARAALVHGRLERVGHVGTAYVSGLRGGTIGEHELQDGPFANAYERSKFEAESLVREIMPELPLVILRPSIVVGDSRSGRTTSFNVLYPLLDWIRGRRISILPGYHTTPADIVPIDFVSRAIVHLVLHAREATGKTFHLAAGRSASWTVGEVVDRAVEYFNRINGWKLIPQVRFVPPGAFHTMLQSMASIHGHLRKMLTIYEPYLSITRVFDTANTTAVLRQTGIAASHPSEYFERLMDYCLSSNWGRADLQIAS